ncbi:Mu-like prophage major head subunit gpT family protein [Paracoccus sp. IB05]|nr:Mu-like prophage major head subunit gpT family protein [Paracoccus sp. IB05]
MLAVRMQDADDIDPDLLQALQAVVDLAVMHGVDEAETLRLLEQAFEQGEPETDEDPETAPAKARMKPGDRLISSVVAHFRGKGPSVTKHKPGYGVLDQSPAAEQNRRIDAMADGLLARMDARHVPTIGRQYAGMSLAEMAGGRDWVSRSRMASHTSSDFPLVLENALGKSIARRLEQAMPALALAAHEIPALDYRGGNLLSLSASGMPEEVGEAGEIKHVTIDERGERKPAPRDYAAMFTLSRKAIVNDDLGMLSQINQQLGAGAIERFRRILLAPLLTGVGLGHVMSDGKTVFHADHGNLAPTGAALSVTSLSNARLALRGQRGSQGEYYAIEPWALVVPPALETSAQMVLAEINAAKTSDVNPFSGTLDLIVEPGLTSEVSWYLIGNPSKVDGLAYSFLDGEKTPRIESKPGWNTLGVEFRLVWALDARFVSYASWFKNPGA